ncbi:MAG: SPOR domain-containing protein [Halioglobus sp.]
MNNDNQDDRDSPESGDRDRQLDLSDNPIDRDNVDTASRQAPSFAAFDTDQATELDDLEAEDFGTEYIDNDDEYDEGADAFSDSIDEEDDESVDIWQQPATPDSTIAAGSTNISPTAGRDQQDEVDIWAETDSLTKDQYRDTADSEDWPAVDDDNDDDDDESENDWRPPTDSREQTEVEDYDEEARDEPEAVAAEAYEENLDEVKGEEIEAEESWQRPLDDEQWEDNTYAAQTTESEGWPIGLIIVAVVALLLLAGGGYGVMQQRSAMQEEIRELRAQLATAANPAEVTSSRDAQRELVGSNAELESRLNVLTLENRQLSDTVEGLEGQLDAQRLAAIKLEEARTAARKQAASRSSVAVAPKAAPAKPAAPPAPKATTTTASGSSGTWFVNFGSYSQQTVASDWAVRLQKTYGRVVVAPASANGKTVYRVRVVDVTSKARADEISGQLQEQYKLPTLWVGRQ